jgi:hypothetical protein
VKNGSKALAMSSGDMPMPVSDIAIMTYWPGFTPSAVAQ